MRRFYQKQKVEETTEDIILKKKRGKLSSSSDSDSDSKNSSEKKKSKKKINNKKSKSHTKEKKRKPSVSSKSSSSSRSSSRSSISSSKSRSSSSKSRSNSNSSDSDKRNKKKSRIKYGYESDNEAKNAPYLKENKILDNKIKDCYAAFYLDNTFCVFHTINNGLYLVYCDKRNAMICFDLINVQKISEIKNAHNHDISNFKHFLDKPNKRDLILSISPNDNNVRLWNLNTLEILLDIKDVNKEGSLYSACFLFKNNKLYIVTTNCSYLSYPEPIKIFNNRGYKIKEVKDSNDNTYFIDVYYDTKNDKSYIITGNNKNIKSFDSKEYSVYNEYCDINRFDHSSIIIYDKDIKQVKMIESCTDGKIRIWDFHTAEIIKRIKVSDIFIYGMALWDDNYLFVGCKDNQIKLLELNSGKKVAEILGHTNEVVTCKKVHLPKYGDCLITQGLYEKEIKLWVSKKLKI